LLADIAKLPFDGEQKILRSAQKVRIASSPRVTGSVAVLSENGASLEEKAASYLISGRIERPPLQDPVYVRL
jgi:hypothetical protein